MVTTPVLPTLVPALLPGRFSWGVASSIPFERRNKIIPEVSQLVLVLIRRTSIQNCMVDIVAMTAILLTTPVPASPRVSVTSGVMS